MRKLIGLTLGLGLLALAGCNAIGGCDTKADCPGAQVCCARGGAISPGDPPNHCLEPHLNPDGGLGGYALPDGGPSGCLPEI